MYKKHKKTFELWVFSNKSQSYSEQIIKCTNSLFNTSFTIDNIKQKINENQYCNKYLIVSFRNFLNYCELNDLLDLEVINKFRTKLKINIKSNIDTFVPTKSQIKQSLDYISSNFSSQFLTLYRIMLESGLRYTELKEIITNFDKEKVEIYKNKIVTYANFYIRGKKSSYFMFMTYSTYNELLTILPNLNSKVLNSFKQQIQRKSNVTNLKYLRKYNFTLMIENNVNFEIANFIQGRASQNIGFNHYLSKKSISLQEYSKILEKLKEL